MSRRHPGLRHGTGLTPAGLQGTELGIGATEVLGVLHQVLEFLYDFELAVQTGLLLLLKILEIHGTAALVTGIQLLEGALYLYKRIYGHFLLSHGLL